MSIMGFLDIGNLNVCEAESGYSANNRQIAAFNVN